MPKEDELLWIRIYPSGKVTIDMDLQCKWVAEAVEVLNHGDLIDREYAVGSACSGRITTENGEDWIRVEEVRQSLKSVPAVIPAERSNDE